MDVLQAIIRWAIHPLGNQTSLQICSREGVFRSWQVLRSSNREEERNKHNRRKKLRCKRDSAIIISFHDVPHPPQPSIQTNKTQQSSSLGTVGRHLPKRKTYIHPTHFPHPPLSSKQPLKESRASIPETTIRTRTPIQTSTLSLILPKLVSISFGEERFLQNRPRRQLHTAF